LSNFFMLILLGGSSRWLDYDFFSAGIFDE